MNIQVIFQFCKINNLLKICREGGGGAEEVRQGQQGQLNMIVNCIIGSSGLHS